MTAKQMLISSGIMLFVDLLVHNKSVKNNKPHPEPYIKAMVLANSLPEETLIVEDSEVGLHAAMLTGAEIWKVKDSSEVTWENFRNKYIK